MREEIEKRIAELKQAQLYSWVTARELEVIMEKIEVLEKFYEAMYI